MKSKPKWKSIFSLWNLLDVAIIVLFVYYVLLIYAHVYFINPLLDDLRKIEDFYIDVYPLAAHQKHEHLILGIIVFASWVKV